MNRTRMIGMPASVIAALLLSAQAMAVTPASDEHSAHHTPVTEMVVQQGALAEQVKSMRERMQQMRATRATPYQYAISLFTRITQL